MPLISLDNVTVDYGAGPVLDGVTFSIERDDRIGLVGLNGEGKTTLLSLIYGDITQYSGEVYRQRNIRIGYLRQEHRLSGCSPLIEAVMESHSEIPAIDRRMHELISEGLHGEKLDEYHELESRFDQIGGYEFKSRTEEVLGGLGFSFEQFGTPVNKLSGGEKNRAAIACLLLEDPDILLLDEPTNHLDFDGLLWLADYLKNIKKPYLVVSHDRFFLDEVSRTTVEVRAGRCTRFAGNYSFYEAERERLDRDLLKRFALQSAEVERIEDFIRKNIAGQKTKQAQSRRKMLERIERLAPPPKAEEIKLRFKSAIRGGDDVLRTEKLSARIGDTRLFEGLELFIKRGERLGIVGPNGCGKTTLLSILAGKRNPTNGEVIIGSSISIGYYSQDFAEIDLERSAFEEIRAFHGWMSDEAIRSALALFSIIGDDMVFRPMWSFSGGETARVALLKLLLGEFNLLLLDEPTNHLDIRSRITLENALTNFDGTIILVSHDRYFLNKVCKRILAFEPDGLRLFDGGFDYYLEKRSYSRIVKKQAPDEKQEQSQKKEKKTNEPKITKKPHKNLFKLREELSKTESEIERLESEIKKVTELLSEEHVASDWGRMSALLSEYENLDARLEKGIHRWEEIEEEISSIEDVG